MLARARGSIFIRSFTCSPASLQSSSSGKKKAPPESSIIVLSAKDSIFSKAKRRKPTINSSHLLHLFDIDAQKDKLLVFKPKMTTDQDLINSINGLKPLEVKVSPKKYSQIRSDLNKSYTNEQLKFYLRKAYDSKGVSKLKKHHSILHLLNNEWNLVQSEDVNKEDDLIMDKTLQLESPEQLFLLLSSNGLIIFHWTRTGAKIAVSPDELQIITRGPRPTLNYIEVSLSKLLAQVHRTTIDFSPILALFSQIGRTLPIDLLSKLSNVYFKKEEQDGVYTLSSLTPSDVNTVKSLTLEAMGYSPRTKDLYLLNGTPDTAKKFPIKGDHSLAWMCSDMTRLQVPKRLSPPKVSEQKEEIFQEIDDLYEKIKSLGKELHASNVISKVQNDFLLNTKVNPNEVLVEQDFPNLEGQLPNEIITGEKQDLTYSEMRDRYYQPEIVDEQLEDEEPIPLRPAQDTPELRRTGKTVFDFDVSRAYQHLSNFIPPKDTVSPENWGAPIFTATLGHSLNSSPHEHFFNPSLSFINKTINRLGFYGLDTKSADQFESLKRLDSYDYFLQVKLVPDLFTSMEDFEKYPPVELLFDIKKIANKPRTNFIDTHTLRVVTTNVENNVIVPLPDAVADVKFSSTITSNLINEYNNDLRQWLNGQDELYTFLQNTGGLGQQYSTKTGVGNIRTPDQVILKIGDREVPYIITDVLHRKQLDLQFGNRLVQFAIQENQHNRKVSECSLVGNLEGGMTEEEFQKFVMDVNQFINSICI